MKKILMRADDLGYCEAVNLGIYKSIHDGFINSVGLMTNMEYAAHGVNLIKNEQVCLGQHTNISAGRPICDPSLIPSLVDENGKFHSSSYYKNSKEDIVLEEVIMEVEAQYHKFIELVGRKPEYFDGHAILSNNFFKALEFVARKYDLKYSPFPTSLNEPILIGNTLVIMNGGSFLDKDASECLKEVVQKQSNYVEMIVYHPGFLDAYIMKNSSLNVQRVYELEAICDENNLKYLKENDVELITYNDL